MTFAEQLAEDADPFLSLPEIGRLLCLDRRRVWEREDIRAVAVILEGGRGYAVRLSDLNKLGFSIPLAQALEAKKRVYTEKELRAAVDNALAARDAAWRKWFRDKNRWMQPDGPNEFYH